MLKDFKFKIIQSVKNDVFLYALVAITLAVFLVNVRINVFRYNNFDFGKFDLGNMSQMLWNTLNGKFMYLTDYFGTNLPRWAMSHVDPILLIFLPLFIIFMSPLTLVLSQVFLVVFSSILVYQISYLETKSKVTGFLLGCSYLLYPAIGYLTATTAFHGVSVVIPFFFLSFYKFEKMYYERNFTKKGLILFWLFLVLTMMGKEQLPVYIMFYGFYILLFRTRYDEILGKFSIKKDFLTKFFNLIPVKTSLYMMLVGFIWFFLAFFVIIPQNAHYRIEGYQKFAESLGISEDADKDVALPNYFLARYGDFGESYSEVLINMLLRPRKSVAVFFGGDKLDNARRTVEPLAYMPLLAPEFLVISLIDFMANYLTTAGGIGTSEISNHRISMIIPVLFIALIIGISRIYWVIDRLPAKMKKVNLPLKIVFPLIVLVMNFYTSNYYNNPVYLWVFQAVQKRIAVNIVYAKTDLEQYQKEFKVGDVTRLSMLDNKDVECARKIVDTIPGNVSISGPDYLGAHLSLRETYAIFPALYNEADYVIVDVFSQKITNILDLNKDIVREVVEGLIKDENYSLGSGCGNLFIFKRVGFHDKEQLMPMQHRYQTEEKMDLPFFESLSIVDYSIPNEFTRDTSSRVTLVYTKREEKRLDDYVMYMSFLNEDTGELYQVANLPSFSITRPGEWKEDQYYYESLDLSLPAFLESGRYKVFIGMSNKIRTRSMYLGSVLVN